MSSKKEMTLADQMWRLHTTFSSTQLTQLIPLESIPQKMHEVEKKYWIRRQGGYSLDAAISATFGQVDAVIRRNKLGANLKVETFVGIDQYYIFTVDEKEYHYRYRSGANRQPQLTVKYQAIAGSNLDRGEVNIPIESAHPDGVRAFMSVVAAMFSKPPITFAIQQSGQIWILTDTASKRKVEIVVYRVYRSRDNENSPRYEAAFIEIEPLKFPIAKEALDIIERYEVALSLKAQACPQSIAELFRPGNEKLLGY